MRGRQARLRSSSRISSFLIPARHTLLMTSPRTWQLPKPFWRSACHSPVHSRPSLKKQLPSPSRTPPAKSPAYRSPVCHSICAFPSSTPLRHVPRTWRPSLSARMPSPWNWSSWKSPSYMPSSKQNLPLPALTPSTKLPSQKALSGMRCLPNPCRRSPRHVPSSEDPSGSVSLPCPLAAPSATSPSQLLPSGKVTQTFSRSASCPRKNWPVSVVPSSQATFPRSCGCLSTVVPVQRTPRLSQSVWMEVSMERGFLTGSTMLWLSSGLGFFLGLRGCSMMTDSPKLRPRERESSLLLRVGFFLQSPCRMCEMSSPSLFLGSSFSTSRILQSAMGVSHSGHSFPILLLFFIIIAAGEGGAGGAKEEQGQRGSREQSRARGSKQSREQKEEYEGHLCGRMESLYCTHSTSRMQSLNFSDRPALPRTATMTPPSKQPTKESPPSVLQPVLPPRHPSASSRFVFSSRHTRRTSSPSSFTARGFITCCRLDTILQNSGILKHSAASLATSMAEAVLAVRPCGLAKALSQSWSSLAYRPMRATKRATLGSLFSWGRSKQLKQRLALFLRTKLPRLLAMVSAMLLAEVTSRAKRASSRVSSVSSCGSRGSRAPPTALSSLVTSRSKALMLTKYSLTISYAVKKVSSLEMLAMGCGWRYLQPLMMAPLCMLRIAHFLAVTCDSVTSRSMWSRLGHSDAARRMWIGCGTTARGSSGRQSFRAANAFELRARSRTNDSGSSASGRRWKMVLWKRVVSQRRWDLPWGSGSEASVATFLREKEGSRVRGRGLAGEEGSVLRVLILLLSMWALFIMVQVRQAGASRVHLQSLDQACRPLCNFSVNQRVSQ